MNTRNEEQPNCVPDPHPCSLNTNQISEDLLEKDYEDLINCCQRHMCRPDSYCKSKSKKLEGKCRFGYPFKLENNTRIEFIETKNTVRAEIALMRNDSNMNVHNRLICHNWRGNVDMQVILDKRAAIDYMVKYATKGEKSGLGLQQLYQDVIGASNNEDNSATKIRSLFLRNCAGNRDIGQCEVSRLLMSDPLYHSSFMYITLSTDLNSKEINLDKNASADLPAYKKSMIDFYANRKNIDFLQPYLHQITNLISFVKLIKLNCRNNKLELRPESHRTVVITYPKYRYNPQNKEKNKLYC